MCIRDRSGAPLAPHGRWAIGLNLAADRSGGRSGRAGPSRQTWRCTSWPMPPATLPALSLIHIWYRPGEDDPHLKVLQAAHISDDEYFSHMVLDDLNLIIRDIRETHKKDSESAPQTTVADELKENLEAVENFKGSRLEKLAMLYCKQLGINYKNLSEEEFRWLIRILQKSKKMGTPISQRKKR